ncbi:hypothetical protein L2E82_21553 [Cichorium intybus]|uniref:Uncharacterized protein n=1 Tax=Cichorium intybus TaxID=13427 RepID=A0ACB9DVN6_CICIN|nr:hypothetical protein L2E82_21553 [Cichorium intybus]
MLACFATCNATEYDISCLKSIKESLEDPSGTLSKWEFTGMSKFGFCEFPRVRCWGNKNKVHSIDLAGMRLRGPLPIGIINCTNMSYLDLSSNYLSGPIPSNIGDGLGYIIALDLSNNNLSGPIPPSIVKWKYINSLRLDNNRLTGQIPPDMTALERIKVFNVTNNRLSGPVPIFRSSYNFSAESYANNSRLCGGPLKACNDEDNDDIFISGFAVGFSLFTILSMFYMFYFP